MLVTEDKELDLFVASKIGSFKHIKYYTQASKNSKKCIENLVEIKSLQKDDAITCMVWGNTDQTEILIGRKNQQIQVYNTIQGFTKTYTADFATGDIVGLGKHKRRLVAALTSGTVQVWSKKEPLTVNTCGKLDRMQLCEQDSTLFATGGEENDLKVWRIGDQQPLFTAKNLPNDWLQLRRPVWVTDLTFLSQELLAVCSRHGYVRLYDSRAQRRPVCNVDFEAKAATCITKGFDERQVFVGFGRGHLHQVDLRRGKPDKGYKGAVGAITSIALHDGLLVSTSLDRHIRVHDRQSKDLLYKQYLTSKLTCALVQSATSTPLRRADAEVKEEEQTAVLEDDMDTMFDNMETIGEKPRKKRTEALDTEVLDTEVLDTSEAKKLKPSTEGSTADDTIDSQMPDEAIAQLLRSTERQKRRMEKRKREKKAKSIYHNA
ncbi:WD repeat-containing protein 74 [Bicyclus anynana]|uniref:WD repeat-containing protein 74 n=1 Tax=Bicyclus anynana TaxID=110368 RepID=A0ABM3M323_BICAN|nr:WD repeat-containing protein 74 [Bicyclus anynana]